MRRAFLSERSLASLRAWSIFCTWRSAVLKIREHQGAAAARAARGTTAAFGLVGDLGRGTTTAAAFGSAGDLAPDAAAGLATGDLARGAAAAVFALGEAGFTAAGSAGDLAAAGAGTFLEAKGSQDMARGATPLLAEDRARGAATAFAAAAASSADLLLAAAIRLFTEAVLAADGSGDLARRPVVAVLAAAGLAAGSGDLARGDTLAAKSGPFCPGRALGAVLALSAVAAAAGFGSGGSGFGSGASGVGGSALSVSTSTASGTTSTSTSTCASWTSSATGTTSTSTSTGTASTSCGTASTSGWATSAAGAVSSEETEGTSACSLHGAATCFGVFAAGEGRIFGEGFGEHASSLEEAGCLCGVASGFGDAAGAAVAWIFGDAAGSRVSLAAAGGAERRGLRRSSDFGEVPVTLEGLLPAVPGGLASRDELPQSFLGVVLATTTAAAELFAPADSMTVEAMEEIVAEAVGDLGTSHVPTEGVRRKSASSGSSVAAAGTSTSFCSRSIAGKFKAASCGAAKRSIAQRVAAPSALS